MNSKKYILSAIIIVSIIIVIIVLMFLYIQIKNKNFVTSHEKDVNFIKNSNINIFVYGNETELKDLKINYIKNLNEIDYNKPNIFIVINDLNRNVNLTKKDINKLKKDADESNIPFIYLGENLYDFEENGFDFNYGEDDLCLIYYGNNDISTGLWTRKENEIYKNQNDKFLLEQVLVHKIKSFYSR